jgi:hypothetical protein
MAPYFQRGHTGHAVQKVQTVQVVQNARRIVRRLERFERLELLEPDAKGLFAFFAVKYLAAHVFARGARRTTDW